MDYNLETTISISKINWQIKMKLYQNCVQIRNI